MKTAIIMRGIPGSGKSTVVDMLKGMYGDVSVCSADNYFINNGEYKFIIEDIAVAHWGCQDKFREALEEGIEWVICDNTNTRPREYKMYIDWAKEYGYQSIVIVLEPGDIETHFKRNIHNVPIATVQMMHNRLSLNIETIGADKVIRIPFGTSLEKIKEMLEI